MSDPFDDIINGLQIQVDESEVVDVSQLETPTIMDMIEELNNELLEAHQGLRPTQQWARDKHSLRNALQVELSKRIG
jgi:hypothetical protein